MGPGSILDCLHRSTSVISAGILVHVGLEDIYGRVIYPELDG